MPEKPFKRTDRVSDLLRKVVSEVFLKGIHHQSFDQVTVTGVKITPDLKSARIYYRLLDPSRRTEIMHAMQDKAKLIRKEVGAQLKLRSTPRLTFEYDESIDYGDRIEQLLSSIKHSDNEEE